MPDNSSLGGMLRAASPARTAADAKPDAAALVARDRILNSGQPTHRRHRTVTIGWASGLALATASALIAAVLIVPQTTARAGAPLSSAALAPSVAEIVDEAQADLSMSSGPAAPQRFVRTASWNFSVDAGTGELRVFTQLSTISWEPDGSGHVVLMNSPERDPADAEWYSHAEMPFSGDVEEFPMLPGEFVTPVMDPPAESLAGMQEALVALEMPDDPSAFEVVTAVTTLLGQWTLTNAQHAALLRIIEDAGGAEAVPATHDRLGRAVDGLRVMSPDGAVSDVVLVSADTGRIVGVERTVVKADSLLPAGAILGSQLWDVEGLVE
ncbi:hypothetical protein KZC51_12815 [Microbacterium sp. SSW1-49]|uniref:CU044_5270 family protein n=1 Tax=Microbacterium croceum TaxID=2851645 RepID=A0ABT0FG26_9MICO|nr:hypothetical protein [Microbacterium croceum]MCK2037013.1 hypothetical protein [Microbacterium croceum]